MCCRWPTRPPQDSLIALHNFLPTEFSFLSRVTSKTRKLCKPRHPRPLFLHYLASPSLSSSFDTLRSVSSVLINCGGRDGRHMVPRCAPFHRISSQQLDVFRMFDAFSLSLPTPDSPSASASPTPKALFPNRDMTVNDPGVPRRRRERGGLVSP